MHALLWPTINLIILVIILTTKLKVPVADYVKQRHVLLRDEVKSVRDVLLRAQEQYDEFSSKLKAIEAEADSLLEQAKQDAQAVKLRVLSEAQKASSSIIADARGSAESLYADLKGSLSSEMGLRILDRTEAMMRERLTGEDRTRIQNEFSKQLENSA